MEAGTAAAKPIINVAAICGSFPYNIDLLRAGGRSKTEQGLVDSSLRTRIRVGRVLGKEYLLCLSPLVTLQNFYMVIRQMLKRLIRLN
ncbi:uncharacterized protein LOC110706990 isoform X3 [Chenopodium quinoa]|uniref:uncharacterized protein LOC110706990 isoform X3 n=1 Tax=Chenopodium quinoa TaxID=63459 RepID=UPI000B7742A3|nr:uncharacterized protein LOC110706990 isoform X3 [Chenopodium quinoa]